MIEETLGIPTGSIPTAGGGVMPAWTQLILGVQQAATLTEGSVAVVAIIGAITGTIGGYNAWRTRKSAATKDYVTSNLELMAALGAERDRTITRLQADELVLRADLADCRKSCAEALRRIAQLERREKP